MTIGTEIDAEKAIEALKQACRRTDGNVLVMSSYQLAEFRLLTERENAFHGIIDKQGDDNNFKNQVSLDEGGERLVFEIYTAQPIGTDSSSAE